MVFDRLGPTFARLDFVINLNVVSCSMAEWVTFTERPPSRLVP